MALDFYQTLAADLVRDDAGQVAPEQIDAAVGQAVARLSDAMPRESVVEQSGVAGNTLATPAGWEVGASRLVRIEYPVGRIPREFVSADRTEGVDKPDGSQEILLLDALPAASTVRMTFTRPHQVDDQVDSVPQLLRWGVAALTASILCGQLASRYANQGDSTIAADSVDSKSRSELFAAREREYRAQAYASWGLPVPGSKAALASETRAAGAQVSFESRRGSPIQRGLRWL